MANFANGWIVNFIVSHQAGKNCQTRCIRRRPRIRPAIIRVHVEKRPRASEPFPLGRIVKNIVKLVEIISVSIDDQEMTVLAAAQIDVAWIATFHPVGLANRFRRDGIKRKTRIGRMINAVTFA